MLKGIEITGLAIQTNSKMFRNNYSCIKLFKSLLNPNQITLSGSNYKLNNLLLPGNWGFFSCSSL